MSYIDLKDKLAKQMLSHLPNELVKVAKGSTLYRLSYGQYKVSNYEGELLIEFDEAKPGYGIYYGFMITNGKIDKNEVTKIDNIFSPIMQHLGLVLKKFVYLTDGVYDKYYWPFWLRCDDFDIDSAKKHMEIIQDFFNLLAIKYNVVKI